MKDYTIYVTEEIAKKAMEKGFDCSKLTITLIGPTFKLNNGKYCTLPTAEQICGWLDEKHIQTLVGFRGESWYYYIMNNSKYKSIGEDVNTRKEALLEGINKTLDLI